MKSMGDGDKDIGKKKRRTDPDLVAFKRRPVDLLTINLDKSPVVREHEGFDGDLDLLRVKHEANSALVECGKVLGDLSVDRFHLLDLLCSVLHQAQVLPTFISHLLALSLFGLPKPVNRIVPSIDSQEVVAYSGHHGVDGLVVALYTKRDDFLTMLTIRLSGHAGVGADRRRRASDVSACQNGDTVVVSRKAEVQSSCAFVKWECTTRDGEAESWSEWFAQVGDLVDERVEGEQLWSNSTIYNRLDESDFDVGEASAGEDVLDDGCTSNSSLVGEGTGVHADAYDERAEWLGLPSIGVGEGVDAGPNDVVGLEVVTDARANVKPSRLNRMGVNWARLTDEALTHRALCGPLGTRLVDTGGATTIEVAKSERVIVGEAAHLKDDVVASHGLSIGK